MFVKTQFLPINLHSRINQEIKSVTKKMTFVYPWCLDVWKIYVEGTGDTYVNFRKTCFIRFSTKFQTRIREGYRRIVGEVRLNLN